MRVWDDVPADESDWLSLAGPARDRTIDFVESGVAAAVLSWVAVDLDREEMLGMVACRTCGHAVAC